MDRVPCVVIGAGVVGLAAARTICLAGVSTLVLEKYPSPGMENSSRNSEVLHAGLYYPPDSLKSRLCLQGRGMLLRYMQERDINHRLCGKLVIAADASELATLSKILSNTPLSVGLKPLGQAEVHSMEPAVRCVGALHSPGTGILDSHGLMQQLERDVTDAGSDVLYNCEVQGVTRDDSGSGSGFIVRTAHGPICCDYLVNAAGLHAPLLAHTMPFYPAHHLPRTYYAKGNYYR
ncbi:FAD dependent oxidoreductase, partial [Ochromonadaceae sp. CCMP2298]